MPGKTGPRPIPEQSSVRGCLKKPLLYNVKVVIITQRPPLSGAKVEANYQITKKHMNKQALADWVHGKLGGTKVQAEEIVDGLFGAIIDTLKKGGEVSIAGFGIFSVKQRAARMARNPKTGEQVKVAAKKVPKFRAAKGLKDTIA